MKSQQLIVVRNFALFMALFGYLIPSMINNRFWKMLLLSNVDIIASVFATVGVPSIFQDIYTNETPLTTITQTIITWFALYHLFDYILFKYFKSNKARALRLALVSTLVTFLLPPILIPKFDHLLSERVPKLRNNYLRIAIHFTAILTVICALFWIEHFLSG